MSVNKSLTAGHVYIPAYHTHSSSILTPNLSQPSVTVRSYKQSSKITRAEMSVRLHKPLRQSFRKLRQEHPKIGIQFQFSVAFKSLDYTFEPGGVVPSALLFGYYPSVHSFKQQRICNNTWYQRSQKAEQARRLMDQHIANARASRALKKTHHRLLTYYTNPATASSYGARRKLNMASERG